MYWCIYFLAEGITSKLKNMADFLLHVTGKPIFLIREVGFYYVKC